MYLSSASAVSAARTEPFRYRWNLLSELSPAALLSVAVLSGPPVIVRLLSELSPAALLSVAVLSGPPVIVRLLSELSPAALLSVAVLSGPPVIVRLLSDPADVISVPRQAVLLLHAIPALFYLLPYMSSFLPISNFYCAPA